MEPVCGFQAQHDSFFADIPGIFDLLNLFNLFDREAGLIEFGNFNNLQPAAVTTAGGRFTYDIAAITATNPSAVFLRDDLRSRWQAQLGARIRF